MTLITSNPSSGSTRSFPARKAQETAVSPVTAAWASVGGVMARPLHAARSALGWNDLPAAQTTLLPDVELELSQAQVTDFLAIVAAPMALAGISLAGAPMTAMAAVLAAPLAVLYCWGTAPDDMPEERTRMVVDVLSRLLPALTDKERPSDTEGALLEYLVTQIEKYKRDNPGVNNGNLVGKLVLFTELTPCDSCQGIINQFRAAYPNIRFDVYFSYAYGRDRAKIPLQDTDIQLWTPTAP